MKGVLLAIAMSACATTSSNTATSGPPGMTPTQQQTSNDEQVCQEVSHPGSLMTRTECRPKSEADADREQMRTWMTTPKASKDFPATTSPGSSAGPGH
jgi:hypothetical protein